MANLLRRISSLSAKLPRAERQVAEWILEHQKQWRDASLAELAAAAQVSEPTVIRFCRSLGLRGYREFRTQLAAAKHEPDNYFHRNVTAADTPAIALTKVLDSAIKSLIELNNHASDMPINNAVDTLVQSRQIIFVGVGASGHVAQDAQHKLFRLGIPCTAAKDVQTIMQYAAIAAPEDTFVAISNNGVWPDLVASIRIATGRNANVIALTKPHSPLAQEASLVFPCYPQEDANVYTPMNSRLNHLALLDALQVALALKLGIPAQEKLQLSKEALSPLSVTPAHPSNLTSIGRDHGKANSGR